MNIHPINFIRELEQGILVRAKAGELDAFFILDAISSLTFDERMNIQTIYNICYEDYLSDLVDHNFDRYHGPTLPSRIMYKLSKINDEREFSVKFIGVLNNRKTSEIINHSIRFCVFASQMLKYKGLD